MAINQKFKERRVNSLPTSNLSAGDRYYLNVGNNKYQTYIVSDGLQLIKEDGAEFIEKDTMAEMRDMSSREIWALQNGYYKGVKLNGYHAKDDTPSPIEYYMSLTTSEDDGGSVIEVGGVKLEHKFNSEVDVKYFGAKCDNIQDDTSFVQKAIDYISSKNGGRIRWNGKSIITDTIWIKSSYTTIESDSKIGLTIVYKKSNSSVFRNYFTTSLYYVIYKNINIESTVAYTGVKGFDFSGLSYSETHSCVASLRGENTGGIYVEHAHNRGSYYNSHYDFVFTGNKNSSIGYDWNLLKGEINSNRGVNATRVFGGRISVCKIGAQLKGSDNLFCGVTFESLNTTEGVAIQIGDAEIANTGAGNTIMACAMESGYNFINIETTAGINYEIGCSATGLGSGGSYVAGDTTKLMKLTGGAQGYYFPLTGSVPAEFGGNVLIKSSARRFINRDTNPAFVTEGLSGTTPDVDVHFNGRISSSYAGGVRILPVGGVPYYAVQFDRTLGSMVLVQENTINSTPVYSQRILSSGRTTPEGAVSAPPGSFCNCSNGKVFVKETGIGNTGWVELVKANVSATTTTKGLVNRTTLIESITTPDATDAATAQILANANKAKINELLQKLNIAGIIIGDIV